LSPDVVSREAFVVSVAVAVVALLNFVPVIVIICQVSNHGFEKEKSRSEL